MEEKTVILKIRGFDPLCVDKKRLTAESSVFRFLIEEIRESELELDDFDPNTVYLFLTLLDDKNVTEIEECRFRELHKMAVVFNVEWLIGQCRDWLVNKLNQLECPAEYEAKLYLFEECRYILNKWNENKFMDLLISKHATMDNTTFISRYMHSYDSLEIKQLALLLKLSGINTKVILETIILNITNKQSIDDKTRYLLQNINLSVCLEKDEELYHQMFEKLSNLSQLTLADHKMISELLVETGRKVFHRKKRSEKSTTVWNREKWITLRNNCKTLNDVISMVGDGRVTDMFTVVKLLLRKVPKVYSDHHLPNTEDTEVFVKTIENISSTKPLKKVSYHYIDLAISILKVSEHPNTYQLIALLELVRNSDTLSSDQDYVHLVSDGNQRFYEKQSTDVVVWKYPFEYRHPGISDCQLPGKCGFVLKHTRDKEGYLLKVELCTEETDYNSCEIHYHNIVCTEDIHRYTIFSATKQDGTKLSGLLGMDKKLFSSDMIWKEEQQCVDYYINIRDYLVAK